MTPRESVLERRSDLNSDGLPPSDLGQVRLHFQTTLAMRSGHAIRLREARGTVGDKRGWPLPGGGRVCQPLLVGTNMPAMLSRASPVPEPSAAAALGVGGLSGLAILSSFSFLDAA